MKKDEIDDAEFAFVDEKKHQRHPNIKGILKSKPSLHKNVSFSNKKRVYYVERYQKATEYLFF